MNIHQILSQAIYIHIHLTSNYTHICSQLQIYVYI